MVSIFNNYYKKQTVMSKFENLNNLQLIEVAQDLDQKNQALEAAQKAFIGEITAEIKTFEKYSKFTRFFKAVALVWQILATSEQYFKEVED